MIKTMLRMLPALALAEVAWAQDCSVQLVDIGAEMAGLVPGAAIATSDAVDPDSNEPVRRYALILADGSLLTLEQKHCMMANVTATLLSPEPEPSPEGLDALARAQALTPTAMQWFGDEMAPALGEEFASPRFQEALGVPGGSSYSIDDRLSASGESSEVIVGAAQLSDPLSPYESIVWVYVGVGGL